MGYTIEQIKSHLSQVKPEYSIELVSWDERRINIIDPKGYLLRGFDLIKIGTNKQRFVDKSNINHWLKFMGLPEID